MDGRPHLLHNLLLLSRFLHRHQLILFDDRHKGVNNLPKVVTPNVPEGSRTCNLLIVSPTLYL